MAGLSLSSVAIRGYRSIRDLAVPVERVTLLVGENGVGKSNIYKALGLLRAAAEGPVTRAIAEEGGVRSVLWMGPRRRGDPVRLKLGVEFADEREGGAPQILSYAIEIGLPAPAEGALCNEPLVKEERIVRRAGRRDVVMLERKGAFVMLRNESGVRETHADAVLPSETALSVFRDGTRHSEIEAVRRALLGWRLYHDFRTDAASPIRRPCHAITTPSLSADGHDLAAVLATLSTIRQDTALLSAAVGDAFPGALIASLVDEGGCSVALAFPGMPRPFAAHELSDGTLRYLCLLGALMGYRLPPLIAFNEPETSLHPTLLAPLARLIGRAARETRILVVTHSETLARAVEDATGARPRRVVKPDGATTIEGLTLAGDFDEEE